MTNIRKQLLGLIVLVIVLITTQVHAQKYDNIWLMGNWYQSSQLEFNSSNVTIDTINKGVLRASRTMTSICDSLGNLLFYTNGIRVQNSQHQLIQNGDTLGPSNVTNNWYYSGNPIPNSTIILPHPVQSNKYYIFHQSNTFASDAAGFSEHLYYSLVDMNANNGQGRVEIKNQIIVSDSLCQGQLHAVKHANGRDWWLIQGKSYSTGFYTFLIHENQITLEHEQYIGNPNRIGGGSEEIGQAVFSPQGDKYARYEFVNDIDIYDFDRCTGLFSNYMHIPIQDSLDNRGGVLLGWPYLQVGSIYMLLHLLIYISLIYGIPM